MSSNVPQPRLGRRLLRQAFLYLGSGFAFVAALLFLAVLMMRLTGPIYAVQLSAFFKLLGPVLLLALIVAIVVVWHFWEPLVRSRQLPEPAKEAWTLARNRVAVWGLAYASLGAYLLFIR